MINAKKIKIKDFAEVITGGTPRTNKKEYWNGNIPWLPSGVCQDCIVDTANTYITELGLQESSAKIMPIDTVLIALTGATTGKTGILKIKACANQSVTGILPNKKYIPNYLFYYLISIRDKILYDSYGGAQKHISQGYVKEIEVPLPNIKEQEKIVEQIGKVQEIIEIRIKQIEELSKLIKSQYVELFGKITEYERLEKYSTLITKGSSPKWQGINYKNEGTLFITSENVREGYVDISKPKYLDNKINEILPRSILKKNDILINIVGASIGRAAKYDYDYLANINQAVALVRTENINSTFLLTYLNSDEAIKMYDDMKKGGARENLSLKNISDLQIPKAPIELQNQFAEFVKQIDKQKLEIQKSLEEVQKLKESLMDKYFGG